MKNVFVLTALALMVGLAGCNAARESSQNKETAPDDAGDRTQEPGAEYMIKYKDLSAGDVGHVTESGTSEGTTKMTDAAGKVLKEDHSTGGETFVYTQTVLEKPDNSKTPTRVRRHYERAERKTGDRTMQTGFHGKTVLIEKKGGKWQFHYEGGRKVDLADAMILYRDFQEEQMPLEEQLRMLLPKKAVKVGETWALDAEGIAKQREKGLLFRLDPSKAVGQGRLKRAYQQDGRQFAVVELTLDTPVVGIGTDRADEGSRQSQKATIDGCIDGTSGTFSATTEEDTVVGGSLVDAGKKGKLTVTMRVKLEMTRKDLGKK